MTITVETSPHAARSNTVSTVIPGVNTPLPLLREKLGPVSRRKLDKVTSVFWGTYLVGAILLLAGSAPAFKAVALGLMFPGGGFWLGGHEIWGLLSLALVLVSVTANRYALPGIWLVSALVAGMSVGLEPLVPALYVVPVLSPAFFFWILFRSQRRFQRALQNSERLNTTLTQQKPLTVRSAPATLGDELSDDDIAHAKYILDRALQPLEEFNGLHELEPYGTSALRYQLNYAQYALAFFNYCQTPAFGGYMWEAQRRLIWKMTDLKAWQYWRGENIWGNLDANPDPIRRDNIMFSGYLGQMLGLYQTVSGDDGFSQPDALRFRWKDGREFSYDLHSIAQAVVANFQRSEYCLYPCEPNWSYTMCNPFGLNTLLLCDRLLGTDYTHQVTSHYRDFLLQEFMTPEGHYIPFRSMLWGINVPGLTLDVNDGLAAFLHHPGLPAIAETSWEMMRLRSFRPGEKFPFRLGRSGRMDIGNYRFSGLGPYSALMMAAREMGDTEVYAALAQSVAEHYHPQRENGELVYPKTSNFTSFMLAVARFGRAGAFFDLVHNGMPEKWRTGPLLDAAPYPDVLVHRAVSDGAALTLGLKLQAMDGVQLQLARLVPGRHYQVTGDANLTLVADADGRAGFELKGNGRLSLQIVPKL